MCQINMTIDWRSIMSMTIKEQFFDTVLRSYDHYMIKLPMESYTHIPLQTPDHLIEHPGFVGADNLLQVYRPRVIAPISDISLFEQNLDIDKTGAFQAAFTLGRFDTGLYVPSHLIQFKKSILTATGDFMNFGPPFKEAWCNLVVTQTLTPGGMNVSNDTKIVRETGYIPHIDADARDFMKGKSSNDSRYVASNKISTLFYEQSFDVRPYKDEPAETLGIHLQEQVNPEAITRYPEGHIVNFDIPQVHRGSFPDEDTDRTLIEVTWTTTPFQDWRETSSPELVKAVDLLSMNVK